MAERYYGLPLKDIRRINRVVEASEAAATSSTPTRQFPAPRVEQWMLLTPFARASDSADGPGDAPVLGRYLTAQAARMQPIDHRCQVLRQHVNWPASTTFRLTFRGVQTALLRLDATEAQVLAALNAIDGLDGKVDVIGYQSEFGQPDAKTVSQARQWHIVFSADVDEGPLLTLEQPSLPLRLFQDWWLPDLGTVETVWAGLPSDGRLRPGAFGWTLPFGGQGLTWLHGECYTWED